MIIGWPRNAGFSCCSHDAKKEFKSRNSQFTVWFSSGTFIIICSYHCRTKAGNVYGQAGPACNKRAMVDGKHGNSGNPGNLKSATYRPHSAGERTNPPSPLLDSITYNPIVTKK